MNSPSNPKKNCDIKLTHLNIADLLIDVVDLLLDLLHFVLLLDDSAEQSTAQSGWLARAYLLQPHFQRRLGFRLQMQEIYPFSINSCRLDTIKFRTTV